MQTYAPSIRDVRARKATARPRPSAAQPTVKSAKLLNVRAPVSPWGVDEVLVQNDSTSVCLLLNRRQATMRVIDFRSGPSPAKRATILAAARREGMEKVFTLVERDEVKTWVRLGFTREGSIPGFYKRSDAWIMGAVVSDAAAYQDADDDDDDDDPTMAALSADHALVERTLARAKRLQKDGAPSKAPAGLKLAPAVEPELRKAVQAATKSARAITGFEPFGRGAVRSSFVVSSRAGFTMHASTEQQSCFDNSLFELLASPTTDAERHATTHGVLLLCEHLKREGAVSTFTFAPADDVPLAAALLGAGFRRSAILSSHLVVGGSRKAAIVFSKKLVSGDA